MKVTEDWRGHAIYASNHVTDELVELVKNELKNKPYVYVSFDVMGRTRHVCLSHELAEKLGDKYEASIGYDHYECKVTCK